MTEKTTTSVVVVSRERPELLARCLTGLSQLYHTNFEVVVVADASGRSGIEHLPFARCIKIVEFEDANISAARNLGISHAAGELIAFIDDDAVPEPTWLCNLTQAFEQSDIAAVGGFVMGRNGISYQWKAGTVDTVGRRTGIDVPDEGWSVPATTAPNATKTEGTNCAFRRAVLVDLGGFDERFHYYLDETDLNMRCARAGLKTAIAPNALVHHGFAASTIRTASRIPTDLHEIGASSAVFHAKYHGEDSQINARDETRKHQQIRLAKLAKCGRLTTDETRDLLKTFDEGYEQGLHRKYLQKVSLTQAKTPFLRFLSNMKPAEMKVLSGRIWSARSLRKKAGDMVAQGHRVSLFIFSPTSAFHRVRFDADGYWEQRGGLFGKSLRDGSVVQFWSFKKRLKAEVSRNAKQRGI